MSVENSFTLLSAAGVVLYFTYTLVYANEIIRDQAKVEKLWMDLHPDVDYEPWDELANLTARTLKNVCDQVLIHLITLPDTLNNYTYDAVSTSKIQSERIVRDALLPLESVNDTGHVPVLKCFYLEKRFYLTHADDNLVFELDCYSPEQEIYTLKSGTYRVEYNLPKKYK